MEKNISHDTQISCNNNDLLLHKLTCEVSLILPQTPKNPKLLGGIYFGLVG